MTIRIFAPAKINLTLHVTGQRADGYHELDSLVVFADIGDWITLSPAERVTLTLTGPFAKDLPTGPDNLACRAAQLMGGNVQICLEKNLPALSGIGGGSSDAAAVLRGMRQLRPDVDVSTANVLGLGADVPVCLDARAAHMTGIGDIVRPTNWPDLAAVLVNPGVGVSTPDVFAQLATKTNAPMTRIDPQNPFDWLAQQRNDLEPAAIQVEPGIAAVLDALTASGAHLARMSGSGATCFGLFGGQAMAQTAAETIMSRFPDWWVQATTLGTPSVAPISE